MRQSKAGMTLASPYNSSGDRKRQWENVLPDTHETDEERTVILDLEGFRRLGEYVARLRETLAGGERPQPGLRPAGGSEVGHDAEAASDLGAMRGQGSGSEDGE